MNKVLALDTIREKLPNDCLEKLAEGLNDIRFGSITINIANGQVENIEKRESYKRKRP